MLLNELRKPLTSSTKAVVQYLNYRLKQEAEDLLYRSILADYMNVLARRAGLQEPILFTEERAKIYGITYKNDKRNAQQIISDTIKSFGLTVVDKDKSGGIE